MPRIGVEQNLFCCGDLDPQSEKRCNQEEGGNIERWTALGMYKATINKPIEIVRLTAIKLSRIVGEIGMMITMIRTMMKSAKRISLDELMILSAFSPPSVRANRFIKFFI